MFTYIMFYLTLQCQMFRSRTLFRNVTLFQAPKALLSKKKLSYAFKFKNENAKNVILIYEAQFCMEITQKIYFH